MGNRVYTLVTPARLQLPPRALAAAINRLPLAGGYPRKCLPTSFSAPPETNGESVQLAEVERNDQHHYNPTLLF